mgnify:CR=1 FL=1
MTPRLLGSVVEDLLDAEMCEAVGAVGRELRIAEDGTGDAVLFPVCLCSLRFALTDDDGINSGGPVVDDRNCLVGLATETVGNDNGGPGQMGYLRPVWIVPTGWWKTAGARR